MLGNYWEGAFLHACNGWYGSRWVVSFGARPDVVLFCVLWSHGRWDSEVRTVRFRAGWSDLLYACAREYVFI